MRNASVHQADLRMLFQSFGMGDYEATMAIQSAFFLPRTTDPDAQVTILLVKGVQRGLNDLGAQLTPNGILGQSTMDYLRVVSGPLWHGKAWVQIYGDIDSARQQGLEFHKLKSGYALSGLGATDQKMACAPTTEAHALKFEELQNQLNRVAHVRGLSKIPISGVIDSKTVNLYNKVVEDTPSKYTNCGPLAAATISGNAISLTRSFASLWNAPPYVAPPGDSINFVKIGAIGLGAFLLYRAFGRR